MMKLIQGEYRKSKEYILNELKNDYFEFNLPYVDENSVFKEINRFNDESKKCTRFKNEYSGNVSRKFIWMDEQTPQWLFHCFMCFLVDRTLEFNNSKLIFICEQICPKELIYTIEDYFDEKTQLIDIGVKTKDRQKTMIGFVDRNNNKECSEERMLSQIQ